MTVTGIRFAGPCSRLLLGWHARGRGDPTLTSPSPRLGARRTTPAVGELASGHDYRHGQPCQLHDPPEMAGAASPAPSRWEASSQEKAPVSWEHQSRAG